MRKRALVNGFLSLLLAAGAASLRAERYFKGPEQGLSIRPTNQNYYLATLTGESESYDPTFYDDHLLTLEDKPVGQFTKVDGKPVDFYWYVTDPQDLAIVDAALRGQRAPKDPGFPRLVEAFQRYRNTLPAYEKDGVYGKTLQIVQGITSVAPQKVVGDGRLSREVDAAVYQYLRSNGVSALDDLRSRPDLLAMVINKFYLLSTTSFYRDYPYIRDMLPFLPDLKARAEKEKRPFKANVFACSTGEEVITYAVELLEAGVTDFTILASDINEPGLRQAEQMRYSYTALDRLPLATQEKIKKYFRLDAGLGVWEPKDPGFFKARIKYIRQDLLKDLPADLDPRFAPPYDLVSIMNVLFYLDDDAVQARKDAWVRMLSPGGILVLHDFHYSVLSGTLGQEWGARHFLPLNSWVNVRADPAMSFAQKAAFWQERYDRSATDDALVALLQARLMAGDVQSARRLCDRHLERNPRSAVALSTLWQLDRQAGDAASAARSLALLTRIQPQSPDTLSKLIDAEPDRRERDFLKALLKAQESFMAGLRGRPVPVEGIFDFKAPATLKYEPLRALLKAYAYVALESRHAGRKGEQADAEQAGQAGLRAIEAAAQSAPGYPVLAQYLDQLSRDLMESYADAGQFDKVLETADRVSSRFGKVMEEPNLFQADALAAHLSLYKALALESLGRAGEARAAGDASVDRFDRALRRIDELTASHRAAFLGDAGRAWMVRGRLRAGAGEDDGPDDDRALSLFESALSYNPLYSRNIYDWRTELLKTRRAPGGATGEVPLQGALMRFHDQYGPYAFSTEVVRYKTDDGASIEATVLTPEDSAPKKPGLVFVHMWARDRNTWWGLPEFLASHGYPSIYMDMRGHGASHFPGVDRRVTVQDDAAAWRRYGEFVNDVVPAIDRMAAHPSVENRRVVVLGASLGCPVGALAAAKRTDRVMGMVMLSPSVQYFGVDCREALSKLVGTPLFVMAERDDKSFHGAKEFFNLSEGYKSYFEVSHLGHGTDALYRDAGLPTVILAWLDQLEAATPAFGQIRRFRTPPPASKK